MQGTETGMLKVLFGSKTRVKLLKTFLLHPEREFYVRELTRKLGEQINGIRRELANLKKIGIVRHRSRDRKKNYFVNKDFILFKELRSIFLKTINVKDDLVQSIGALGDVDFLLFSGRFVKKPTESAVDLLVVGDIDKDTFAEFIDNLSSDEGEIRYSLMDTDSFLYRVNYKDSFVLGLLNEPASTVVVNKLKKFLKSS